MRRARWSPDRSAGQRRAGGGEQPAGRERRGRGQPAGRGALRCAGAGREGADPPRPQQSAQAVGSGGGHGLGRGIGDDVVEGDPPEHSESLVSARSLEARLPIHRGHDVQGLVLGERRKIHHRQPPPEQRAGSRVGQAVHQLVSAGRERVVAGEVEAGAALGIVGQPVRRRTPPEGSIGFPELPFHEAATIEHVFDCTPHRDEAQACEGSFAQSQLHC